MPCFDENTNLPVSSLPRSLLRPLYTNTSLVGLTDAIFAQFDTTRTALFDNPSVQMALALFCLRECTGRAVTPHDPLESPPFPAQDFEVFGKTRVHWFPSKLLELSEFRDRIDSAVEAFLAHYPEYERGDKIMISPQEACRFVLYFLLPDDACGRYTWLLATMLRINVASTLMNLFRTGLSKSTGFNEKGRERTLYAFYRFIHCHLPLVSVYHILCQTQGHSFLSDIGIPPFQRGDMGTDRTLQACYDTAMTRVFSDPSKQEYGCRVLDKIYPSDRHTHCFENMPNIGPVLTQCSAQMNDREHLPIAHLITKMLTISKCSGREFWNIYLQHCQRNPALCAFMIDAIYTVISGGHIAAKKRLSFEEALPYYTLLIAPDALTASVNFLDLISTKFKDVIEIMWREYVAICVRDDGIHARGYQTNPARIHNDFFSVQSGDALRKTISKAYTGPFYYYEELLEKLNIPLAAKKMWTIIPSVGIDNLPVALVRNIDASVIEGCRNGSVEDLLLAETIVHAELSLMVSEIERDDEAQFAKNLEDNYEYTTNVNLQWVKKQKSDQFMSLLMLQAGRVYEPWWKSNQLLPFDQRAKYPADWKRWRARLTEFFDERVQWKSRATFPWTEMLQLGFHTDTVSAMFECENAVHRPEAESHVSHILDRVREQNSDEFIKLYNFLRALDLHSSVFTTDMPLHMKVMQEEALRMKYRILGDNDLELPSHAGVVYWCPSCRKIRSVVADNKEFLELPYRVGVPKAKYDIQSGRFLCCVSHELLAGEKSGSMMKNDHTMVGHYSKTMRTHHDIKPCEDTELIPINVIGKMLHFFNETYCLCMQCGTLAHFDVTLFQGNRFSCGFCEDAMQRLAAFNDHIFDMLAKPFDDAHQDYDCISTNLGDYRGPITEWPVNMSLEARIDALEERQYMPMPQIAREKKAIEGVERARERLQKQLDDKRCVYCIDVRWRETPLYDWAANEPSKEYMDNAEDVHPALNKFAHVVYNDLAKRQPDRREYCFHLCAHHNLPERAKPRVASGLIPLSSFVTALRENLSRRSAFEERRQKAQFKRRRRLASQTK